MGAKKNPFYRLVVADSRYPRDGRFLEEIGYYNPGTNPSEVKIDVDRAKDWLSKGAQPTDTVRALLKKNGVLKGGRSMVELVSFIARSLVDNPEQVDVQRVEEDDAIIIELRVAPDDMGKVIGKQGRIAKAIRTVVKAASLKEDKRVTVEII